ncbi:MAG: DUF2853 family protein [Campylobacterales bacterium]|nr:DUF2853 family protein [Campylobacterales bacterium]
MSKRDEKIALYSEFIAKNNLNVDSALLEKVTIGLGPSIYNKNSELVSCGKASELETVRENFLKAKLGLTSSDEELDSAIADVCAAIGSSVKNKYRAVFYAMLVEKLGKQEVYA